MALTRRRALPKLAARSTRSQPGLLPYNTAARLFLVAFGFGPWADVDLELDLVVGAHDFERRHGARLERSNQIERARVIGDRFVVDGDQDIPGSQPGLLGRAAGHDIGDQCTIHLRQGQGLGEIGSHVLYADADPAACHRAGRDDLLHYLPGEARWDREADSLRTAAAGV